MNVIEDAGIPEGVVCPVCGTDKLAPYTLVPVIDRGNDDGMREVPVHIHCMSFVVDFDMFKGKPGLAGTAMLYNTFTPKG